MKLLAYLSDCSAVPDEIARQIEGVQVAVIDALRQKPHPTHLSVEQALEVAARVRPARTLFTHICHELPQSAESDLPPERRPRLRRLKNRSCQHEAAALRAPSPVVRRDAPRRADARPISPQATIVVYNRNAPDSVALARFYAKARQIPSDHLVGLECSTEEEISRQEYDKTIAEPLRKILPEREWWTLQDECRRAARSSRRIRFISSP